MEIYVFLKSQYMVKANFSDSTFVDNVINLQDSFVYRPKFSSGRNCCDSNSVENILFVSRRPRQIIV